MENLIEYKISAHCESRYAERLLGKDNKLDVNKFIVENRDKIKTDINKMIQFGTLLYVGKQSQKDGKGNVINVYVKDLWIILVDIKTGVVITLYKIDTGAGDDWDRGYVARMTEKINNAKKDLEDTQLEVQIESNMYRDLIAEAEAQINEYKIMIKNLENMCDGYKLIIDNNLVKVSQANRKVAEIVNKMIGKREF